MKISVSREPWEIYSKTTKLVLGSKDMQPIGIANKYLYNTLGFKPADGEGYYPEKNIVYVNVTRMSFSKFSMCEIREALIRAKEIMDINGIKEISFVPPSWRDPSITERSFVLTLREVFESDTYFGYKESVHGLAERLDLNKPAMYEF